MCVLIYGHQVFGSYLYVSEINLDSIIRIAPNGTPTTFYHSSGFSPRGMAFDEQGDLYVADDQSNSILRFSPNGSRSIIATGFDQPQGLAFDLSGYLFVADISASGGGTIYELSPAGSRSTFATGFSPVGLAFDKSGNLYATETKPDDPAPNRSIFKITPSGTQSVFATGLVNQRSLDLTTMAISLLQTSGSAMPCRPASHRRFMSTIRREIDQRLHRESPARAG